MSLIDRIALSNRWLVLSLLTLAMSLVGCGKQDPSKPKASSSSTVGQTDGQSAGEVLIAAKAKKDESNNNNGERFTDATFGGPSDSVNRVGKPQKWQTNSDDRLPKDFAPGDTLIDAWSVEPQTVTPYVSRDVYGSMIQAMVLETLINRDLDTLEHVPGLAKSWKVAQDGKSIAFHLFPNAKFSDGKPVTADDVVFSFDLVANPKIDAPVLRSYITENFTRWVKVDDRTIRFDLKKKYFKALEVCGMFVEIVPKHVYGDYAPKVYNKDIRDVLKGSGPWKFSEWDKDNRIVLERNENYWGPKTPVKKFMIRFIKNELARLQDYKAGNLDQIAPTFEQWAKNANSPEITKRGQAIKYFSPGNGYSYLGYNLRLPKFSDRRVRMALTMSLDREEIVDTLVEGLGEIITGPFYFQSPQYNQDLDPIEYDLKEAKKLLAQAGWKDSDGDNVLDKDLDGDGVRDPFKIVFMVPSGSSYGKRLQRYVQAQFAKVGIQVSLDQLEWPVFEQRLTERKFDMVSLGWSGSPESDPFQIWHSSQSENRGSNYIGYKNTKLDKLIEGAREELDEAKRMKMWHEVHRLIHEDQPYTFLFTRPSRRFIDKRFGNTRIHKLGMWESEWYVPKKLQKHTK